MGPSLRADARVLVRLPSWLGDLVQAEPAVRAVVERVGEERVSLAGPAHLLPVLDAQFPRARRIAHAGRGGERADAWRGHDVALLLTGSFRSAWTAWRAGIPRRVGWSRDARGWLLTDPIRPALERGATPLGLGARGRAPRYLPRPFDATCVELVGVVGVSVARTRPRIAVSDEAIAAVRERLARRGVDVDAPFALANVGARPGSAKGYPAELWASALRSLAGRAPELPIVLTGGPGEEAAVREVRASCGPAVDATALDDPPTSLPELAALLALARVVLAADSGPRHLALAVGARVATVMGPTDPRHSAGHGTVGDLPVLRVPLDCSPCHLERCPLRGEAHHACMRSIDPAELAARAAALVE